MINFYDFKIIEEILFHANKIVNENVNDDLLLAQHCVEIYQWLNQSDLEQQEVIGKYGVFFAVEDDLENHGIPVKKDLREKWDKTALTGLDKELKEIISFYRNDIIKESKKLIGDFEKIKKSKISEIIEQEIEGKGSQSNPHEVDLKKCLVIPPIKRVFKDTFNKNKDIELWIVLEEHPEEKTGYKIIFDEKTKQFGLVTLDLFIGLYGTFLDTLNGMYAALP